MSSRCLRSIALFCVLSACDAAPSQTILGSFFPAWLACAAGGLLAAAASRVALGAVRLHDHVPLPLATYACIAVAVACFTWLLRFGH